MLHRLKSIRVDFPILLQDCCLITNSEMRTCTPRKQFERDSISVFFLSKWYNTYSTHCISFLKLGHFSFFFIPFDLFTCHKETYWNIIILLMVREDDLSARDQGKDISVHSRGGLILSSWFTSKQLVFSGSGVKKSEKEMDGETFQGFHYIFLECQ